MNKKIMNNIHIGCGYTVGKSWKNYDVTPTSRFEKIPVLGKIIKINQNKFPKEVIYGDITKKPLCQPGEADNIFCSHTLEHMAFEEMKTALSNIYTMLKPGGCFRLIVPSLETKVKKYIKDNNANNFIKDIGMGEISKPKKIFSKIRYLFGNSKHPWMYDNKSMSKELENKNFKNINVCKFGDSNIKVFEEVEENERFVDSQGLPEVCIQCTKK
jgi:predicted SAM-dependent methyltransferase